MALSIKEIAEALAPFTKQSDYQYTACCPAHNDKSPSLSLTQGSNGKLLYKCFAGCSQEQVREALSSMGLYSGSGRTWKVLSKAPESKRDPSGVVHYKFGVPVARWEWRNRRGELVGYTYRFEKGDGSKEVIPYSWCRAEEDGKEAWRWKAPNAPQSLYNEHLLDKDKTKTILIVEGEKTVDAAELIFPEYLVMTWQGGTNRIARFNWEVLKNREVVIWPDADAPGTKAAAKIAEILQQAKAKSIKVVDLPKDLPKGWDLADKVPEDVEMDRRALVITAKEFVPSGDPLIDQLNREYAYAIVGGRPSILWEHYNEDKKRLEMEQITFAAMQGRTSSIFVPVGRREVRAAQFWMDHPRRRSYDGITFKPGGESKSKYNLWRGFTYDPDPTGDWSMLEEHLRLNIARGDPDLFNWVFGWFAQMFQQPQLKPGTSLALRGKQGTGKTIIGKFIGALIRDNYVLVDDSRYVTGQFNSHMGYSLLLQADEGFFAGDKSHIGRLKGLITSDTNRIEIKGKESFEINNYLRLLVTSNSDWIVPAAFEERRFAVLDVGEDRMQDKPYFQAMEQQLLGGGYEGLLHALLNFDLSNINVGVVPDTAALTDQKERSLSSLGQFWYNRLLDGELFPGEGGWRKEVVYQNFYNQYVEFSKSVGVPRAASPNLFKKELEDLIGTPLDRIRSNTSIRDDQGSLNRRWMLKIPPLSLCRENFDKLLGRKTKWQVEQYQEEIILDNETQEEPPF